MPANRPRVGGVLRCLANEPGAGACRSGGGGQSFRHLHPDTGGGLMNADFRRLSAIRVGSCVQ